MELSLFAASTIALTFSRSWSVYHANVYDDRGLDRQDAQYNILHDSIAWLMD